MFIKEILFSKNLLFFGNTEYLLYISFCHWSMYLRMLPSLFIVLQTDGQTFCYFIISIYLYFLKILNNLLKKTKNPGLLKKNTGLRHVKNSITE